MIYYFKVEFLLVKSDGPVFISLHTNETDNPQVFQFRLPGDNYTAHQMAHVRGIRFQVKGKASGEHFIGVPEGKSFCQGFVSTSCGACLRVQCEIFYETPLDVTLGGEPNDRFWSAFTTKSNCRCGLNDIIWIEDYEESVKAGTDKKKTVQLAGTFMEGGLVPTVLSGITIELLICVDEAWRSFGKAVTDKKGVVRFEVTFHDIFSGKGRLYPDKLPMRMVHCPNEAAPDIINGTFPSEEQSLLAPDVRHVAEGFLWILHKGTHVVVYDLDGTLTTGNRGIIMQVAFGLLGLSSEPQQISGSSGLCNYWVGKGCLPVYASGRSGIYCNVTRQWLRRHGFPPGLLFLTEGVLPAMPFRASPIGLQSAGSFKYRSLLGLVKRGGVEIAGGYGDIESDRAVYSNLGVPRIYIKPLVDGSYYPHIYDLEKNVLQQSQPAPVPIPTSNLSWTIVV